MPAWIVEGRAPSFMGGPPVVAFGGKQYVWGNMPAIDILKLEENEGSDCATSMPLLFAGTFDSPRALYSHAYCKP